MAHAKQEIAGLVYALQSPDLHKKWGTHPPNGVLLYGPPGTGKTLLAMALAREAEAVFFHVRVTNVVAKWYADSLEVLQTVKLNSADLAEVVRRSLEEKVQQEGAGEEPGPVTTADMQRAIENYRKTKEIIEKIRYGQYL